MNQMLFQAERIEDGRSGIPHIVSNIDVCRQVGSLLAPTLGPYGLDKLFYGKRIIITNDGATILENMDFKHPVARMLASLSKSQDGDVGDGTTSVIVLASSILSALVPLIKARYPVEKIAQALHEIRRASIARLEDLRVEYTDENLQKLAETCLNSKCIHNDKTHFAKILIEGLAESNDLYISRIPGGSTSESSLVGGVAFEKTFTYAGYDQQPKKILNPKVCFLNVELEWKSEKENAEIRVDTVDEYQRVVDSEWAIIKEKLDDVIGMGANVVLSLLPIGDYATQYFASKHVFSAGRVANLQQIAEAFNGRVSNSTKHAEISTCDLFEERQLGKSRYNYFEGAKIKTQTLILRGPGAEALEEVERAVHDAICVIKTALANKNVVTGGGSVEMELSKMCRDLAFQAPNEEVAIYKAVSMAFERIPMQLAENFGLDAVTVMQKLRKAHANGIRHGVSLNDIDDMLELGVLEPMEVKKSAITSAFNVADAILLIDSTIISKK